MKIDIKIVKQHYDCIAANIGDKDVEVYVTVNVSKGKLQETLDKLNKESLSEVKYEIVKDLPENTITIREEDNKSESSEINIVKLAGLWTYDIFSNELYISEDLLNRIESS